MSKALTLAILIVTIAVITAPAVAGKHEDENLGFSLVYPRKWEPVKFGTGDEWVTARFECNREYEWADKEGYWTSHKPYINVVVIPLLAKKGGATVELTDKGVKVERELPYKDLREYLDKTCRSLGGFHFSKEEEAEINGMKVKQFEITVDKLVRGERRVYGWAFYTDDAIYGLVSEVLIDHEKKLRPMILGSFKSLKTFPRTGSLPHTSRTGEDIVVKEGEKEKEREVTDEELKKRRQDATAKALAQVKDRTDKTWTVMESKHFIAVSHADRRYTQSLLKHAEALRRWCEKHLGFVGSGYTGRVVITICADTHEHDAYENARGWSSEAPEVVTYKDKEGWSDWAMEALNRQIYNRWLKDKNDNLYWGAPAWIDHGMLDFIETARSKGNKLEFKPDTWEAVEMKNMRRAKKLLTARDFFTITSDELWGEQQNWIQAQFFVQFLLVGAGSKSSKFKNVFSDYMKSLIFMLDEVGEEEEEKKADEGPKTEEEEDAQYKERQESWRKKEGETLAALIERTFGDWSDKDWDKFTQLFWMEVK